MSFKNVEGKTITIDLVKAIQENKAYLSEIDGAIGDGDHGINMNKGFTMFAEKFADKKIDFTDSLKKLGKILLCDIGGSMGPIYGTFFIEMSKQTKEQELIDKSLFGRMLEASLEGIKELGNAKVGDKTLIDTLEPAVLSYKTAIENGKSFTDALVEMKAAASKGRDSTIDLVAKLGRASRLGERSRGVLDAGATSCCLILCTMADSIIKLVKLSET
ncbi:MAG: dihydroxyacetone kinase subunit DhaL [Ruminiclostridium sp.]